MSDTSDYAAHSALVHLLGSGTYFALFNGDPELGADEVSSSGTSYSRVPASFTITGRTASNAVNTDFSAASAPWGTVTHIAVYDAASAGNRLFRKPIGAPLAPVAGNVVRAPAGFPSITFP